MASGRAKRLHFQKQLEEGAPLPLYEESDIALLENADAKLPIILRKLDEEDEHVEPELDPSRDETLLESTEAPLLNGQGKEVNGTHEGTQPEKEKATATEREEASSRRPEPSAQRTDDASKDKGE